jgi:hypothetical protein
MVVKKSMSGGVWPFGGFPDDPFLLPAFDVTVSMTSWVRLDGALSLRQCAPLASDKTLAVLKDKARLAHLSVHSFPTWIMDSGPIRFGRGYIRSGLRTAAFWTLSQVMSKGTSRAFS